MANTCPIRISFARRPNPDGSTDSICRRCFLTVATSRWESELDLMELEHVCDPVLRERFRLLDAQALEA